MSYPFEISQHYHFQGKKLPTSSGHHDPFPSIRRDRSVHPLSYIRKFQESRMKHLQKFPTKTALAAALLAIGFSQVALADGFLPGNLIVSRTVYRSEEHTSELQS